MSKQKTKISLSFMLKDHSRVENHQIAESNQRIKIVMKETVRDFQKKHKTSIERASQIVLNA
jgi:hypothetical protein